MYSEFLDINILKRLRNNNNFIKQQRNEKKKVSNSTSDHVTHNNLIS